MARSRAGRHSAPVRSAEARHLSINVRLGPSANASSVRSAMYPTREGGWTEAAPFGWPKPGPETAPDLPKAASMRARLDALAASSLHLKLAFAFGGPEAAADLVLALDSLWLKKPWRVTSPVPGAQAQLSWLAGRILPCSSAHQSRSPLCQCAAAWPAAGAAAVQASQQSHRLPVSLPRAGQKPPKVTV